MKRAVFAFAVLGGFAALAGPAIASACCDGYSAGYRVGFCKVRSPCLDGTPRGCPSDPYAPNTYEAGYARGYRDGAAAARRN